ncbi:NlpC/P60 family protein [Blastococcus saxobsidens]|uniref:NlpC/P60 family protein n=1 Tax=Blastococcus saxobsidens TaxID=138336 RepID=A0A6L9W6K9_9ACTN|nr:C40 family peptidase [Blastococcus saxobsidens]NEK87462.1 NlpC/P60 family protein [Blastococcus saxobsidens]
MASSLSPAHRRITGRRALLALLAAGGVALTPFPAAADPQPETSQDAAALIAAKAHDLEVLTERFNETREQLKSTKEAADRAAAGLEAAHTALAEARDDVRTVARSAYTGERLGTLEAMLSSGSPTDLIDRVGMLDTIATHNNGVLGEARQAGDEADRAQASAEQAAAEAQQQVDRVTAERARLDEQIALYQAQYDRLDAEEQRASRAAAERHAMEQAAAAPEQEPAPAAEQEPAASAPADSAPAPAPRAAAAAPAPAPAVAAPAPVAGGSGAARKAVETALAQVGDPYVWAAAGPNAFDCSGLTQFAYTAAGINLPHSSRMQSQMGTPVSRSALQPGDLLFFYSPVSHVGMYVGNGQMVHASTSGVPVKVAPIDSMGNFTSARRIAG